MTETRIARGDRRRQRGRLMEGNAMSETSGVTVVNGVKEYQYFADGEWRSSESKKLFDVYRPYDRGLYARVAGNGGPEAKHAVEAAAKAFPARAATTPAERAKLFSHGPRQLEGVPGSHLDQFAQRPAPIPILNGMDRVSTSPGRNRERSK
jgi:hypothetical protein